MTGKSYSDKASSEEGTTPNWSEIADNAAKRAEDELAKIKREARQMVNEGKESFNNPDE